MVSMDFHAWMLLLLIPLLAIGLVTLKVVQLRRRARPFLQLSHRQRLRLARLIVRDGSLPLVPRVVASVAAGYLAMPVDLIPDFIPVIGHADDFLVVTVLIAVITRTLPSDRLTALMEAAREAQPGLEPAWRLG